MKDWKSWSLLKTPKISQRRFLWVFLGAAVAILLYYFGVVPLVEARKKADEEIALKKRAILQYEEFIRNRKKIEEELDRTTKQYEGIQKKLLPGETPQLGAANLQEIVKRLAEKSGVGIRSFRILEPKEMNVYRRISLHIEFNPLSSISSLSQFIKEIEQQEGKLLQISEMDLLVLNPRMPNSLQGSLVVSGFMKGSKAKEKTKEG